MPWQQSDKVIFTDWCWWYQDDDTGDVCMADGNMSVLMRKQIMHSQYEALEERNRTMCGTKQETK